MKTEYEKCLAGEYFDGTDAELVAMTLRTKRLLRQLREVDFADKEGQYAIYRQLFGEIGNNVHIDIDFRCEYGKHIRIGSRVIINMACTFVDNNFITIGNDVLIASNVQIYTATHPTAPAERIRTPWIEGQTFCNTYARPVTIEDEVWIGGGAIILPGVTIGKGSTIGAGSVVTRSIPPMSVAVGNPCRVIKQLPG